LRPLLHLGLGMRQSRPQRRQRPRPGPPPGLEGLQKPAAFYNHLRASRLLGDTISPEEFAGCEAILIAAAGKLPMSWAAYCLATAFHETGGSMAPNVESLNYTTAERIRAVWPSRFPTIASAEPFVRNAKGLANHVYNGRMGNRPGSDDGWRHRGRGQAHITGREMYAKLDAELRLGGDLVVTPDLALRPDISAQILVVGALKGLFTGKKLNDFIAAKPTREQFVNARRIINPDNNGGKVADAALVFFAALQAGDWR
jgi:putative chitinase